MSTTYPSSLTDTELDYLQRVLPPRSAQSKRRRPSLRTVFDALFYLVRTGCPWQTVYYHFRQFSRTGLWVHLYRELHNAERRRIGKYPHPRTAMMDCESIKTVEESAHISGFEVRTHVQGRKRHLLVDTLGLPLSVYVTPADMHDTQGARRLLAGLKFFVPRLTHFWAGAAYRGQELAEWCKAQGDWDLQVVERTAGMRGFRVQPKRWGVERTFGWLARNRRMNNYYERDVQTSETLIEVAMICLLLTRLGRGR